MASTSRNSSRSSARSRKTGVDPAREKNYKIYAINFYGSGLNSIKDVFYKQVSSGLRRKCFIIDLDEELKRRERESKVVPDARVSKKISKPKKEVNSTDLVTLTQQAIARCRQEFDDITKTILTEKSFDLLTYWTQELAGSKETKGKTKGNLENIYEKPKTAKGKNPLPALKDNQLQFKGPVCPVLNPKPHNRAGRPKPLYKRQYIEDEPLNSKLFIVVMGTFKEQFYIDLLRCGEPLQGITHFIPLLSKYDYLVPNPEAQAQIISTVENIQSNMYQLRKQPITKPVGVFQHGLPIISRCLANKFASQIFDQLCWSQYDIETINQWYQQYYVLPFRETNVSMPTNIKCNEIRSVAESLNLQGHYLSKPLQAFCPDRATMSIYLNSLFNILGPAKNVLNANQISLLAENNSHDAFLEHKQPLNLWEAYYIPAFGSTTKLAVLNRLFIEDANFLLKQLISYVDTNNFFKIHAACLEYKLLRHCLFHMHFKHAVPCKLYHFDSEPFYLPGWAKFYGTMDSVSQRLTKLFKTHKECYVDEIFPNHKLYNFKRTYNEIFEFTKLTVLPSRLCFRDFTIFQLEEFLRDLVTSEMRDHINLTLLTVEQRLRFELKQKNVDIDLNVFIRPNTLKARKMQIEQKNSLKPSETKAEGGRRARGSSKVSVSGESKDRVRKNFQNTSKERLNLPNDNYVGLPPGHSLLKGYNLEDIRQEIFTHHSSYYFEEGSLKYYDERWCFDDMNKFLRIRINNMKLTLTCPPKSTMTTSPNLRLKTKNNICLRILTKSEECAKMLLYYPNGLTIYYYTEHSEQVWSHMETFNNERRRLYTPNGAIIVHFIEEDIILIMRYNGEVYKLHQYELPSEEEEMGMESNEDVNVELKSSGLSKGKPSMSLSNKHATPSKLTLMASHKSKVLEDSKDIKKEYNKEQLLNIHSEDSLPSAIFEGPTAKTKNQIILDSIVNELEFLQFMCQKYGLSYLHLIVTTSVGRTVHITHKGKAYETPPLWNIEWHDYFENESYTTREDGVRMIWTKDKLKCYHTDGSVLITETEESVEILGEADDFEFYISRSSSHYEHESSESLQRTSSNDPALVDFKLDLSTTWPKRSRIKFRTHTNFLTTEGEVEEEEDRSYIAFTNKSFLMQHKYYAAVYIYIYEDMGKSKEVHMEIHTCDNLRIVQYKETTLESQFYGLTSSAEQLISPPESAATTLASKSQRSIADSKTTEEEKTKKRSSKETKLSTVTKESEENIEMEEHIVKKTTTTVCKVWVADSLSFWFSNESCTVNAVLERMDGDGNQILDNFETKFNFKENLTDIFNRIIAEISAFKNYKEKKSVEIYFLEKIKQNCESQGLEFFKELPDLCGYTFNIGNTVTQIEEYENLEEILANRYDWFLEDMKKFPRFRQRETAKKLPIDDFPEVLTVNTYLKIPRQLMDIEQVHKFVEPLENITFKKTRKQIIEATDFYLRPWILKKLQIYRSSISWQRKHRQHRLRLFEEQQRSGLYKAILKHHLYPKYHNFMKNYYGHVKYIEFFSFMLDKCCIAEKRKSSKNMTDLRKVEKSSISLYRKVSYQQNGDDKPSRRSNSLKELHKSKGSGSGDGPHLDSINLEAVPGIKF